MRHYQGLPRRIDRRIIGQEEEHPFDPNQFRRGLLGSQAQPIIRGRSGGNYPQFDEILRDDMQLSAALWKTAESAIRVSVVWMVRLKSA